MRWLSLVLLCACGSWHPPAPAPDSPIPTPPALWPPDPRAVHEVAAMPTETAAEPAPAPAPPPPPAPSEAKVTIQIETPYKMGEREEPQTRADWKADVMERRHWNSGGLGEVVGDMPPIEGHPDPRVIVNVDRVRGPHDKNALQREARKYHWINVVRCYRLGAYKDDNLRGWTKIFTTVTRGGAIHKPRLVETELKDNDVAQCIIKRLHTLKLPRAGRASQVNLSVKVSPGDEPMPPPKDLIVPGDGELPSEAMHAVVTGGLPEIEACYRSAFEYAPGLWGRILLRFHLTERGVLDEVFPAGSRFPEARVQQCIVHAARKFKFPKPKGGDIRFVVPLRLFTDRSNTAMDADPDEASDPAP